MFEACFEHLKQKTGRDNIEDVIRDVKEADKQNHSLQSTVYALDSDIESMEDEISTIKQEIHKLKLASLMGTKRGAIADETAAEEVDSGNSQNPNHNA